MQGDESTAPELKFACLVAIGDDRVGLIHQVSAFLLEQGVNIPSIRTATLGAEFALLAHFNGTAEQVEQVEKAGPALQASSGLSILFHRSRKAPPRDDAAAPTHDVLVIAFDAIGIVSELTAVLAKHRVNVERLGGDVYPAPNQGMPLFALNVSVHVPEGVSEDAVRSDLEALRDRRGWADAELVPHGQYDTSYLAGAPAFPPTKTWSVHDRP